MKIFKEFKEFISRGNLKAVFYDRYFPESVTGFALAMTCGLRHCFP